MIPEQKPVLLYAMQFMPSPDPEQPVQLCLIFRLDLAYFYLRLGPDPSLVRGVLELSETEDLSSHVFPQKMH